MAKRLRGESTRAERQLWKALRDAEGRFRRQAPFGPFIVDFVSHRARLIVEVDGGVHQIGKVVANDLARDRWLGQRGYLVLRFSNDQVTLDADAVLERIAAEVRARTPTPDPSPQGGGEDALNLARRSSWPGAAVSKADPSRPGAVTRHRQQDL